jgi:hypothetical protein
MQKKINNLTFEFSTRNFGKIWTQFTDFFPVQKRNNLTFAKMYKKYSKTQSTHSPPSLVMALSYILKLAFLWKKNKGKMVLPHW